MDQVRGFNAVQDHVHDPDDVGEAFLFLPVEGLGLQSLVFGSRQLVGAQIVVGFTKEARRTDRAVIDRLADLGSQ